MIMGYATCLSVLLILLLELVLQLARRGASPIETTDCLRLREETRALHWRDLRRSTRIVAFGDSIPYGWGLSYRESYPVVLEEMLLESRPRQETRVINAGIPGNTVTLGWGRIDRDVLRWRPHLVLVGFGLNDINLARSVFDERREDAFRQRMTATGQLKAVLRRSLLWSTILDTIKGLVRRPVPQSVGVDVAKQLRSRTTGEVFERALHDIVRRIQRRRGRPILLTMTPISRRLRTPQGAPAELRDLVSRYDDVITMVARSEGAMLIDVHAGMASRADTETLIGPDGVHLNAKGHEVMAGIVHAALLETMSRDR